MTTVAATDSGTRQRDAQERRRSSARLLLERLRARADRAPRGGADALVELGRRLVARASRGTPGRGSDRGDRDRSRPLRFAQARAQFRQRVAQPALRGLAIDAGRRGDLLDRQLAFLLQQERFALRGGQRVDRGEQAAPPSRGARPSRRAAAGRRGRPSAGSSS